MWSLLGSFVSVNEVAVDMVRELTVRRGTQYYLQKRPVLRLKRPLTRFDCDYRGMRKYCKPAKNTNPIQTPRGKDLITSRKSIDGHHAPHKSLDLLRVGNHDSMMLVSRHRCSKKQQSSTPCKANLTASTSSSTNHHNNVSIPQIKRSLAAQDHPSLLHHLRDPQRWNRQR